MKETTMKISGNTILITGGGSGIGRRLAEEFHALGNTVIIAGRRRAALDEVTGANPGMASAALDVADADAIDAFAARIIRDHPDLNVLINNAGVMFAETLPAQQDDLADAETTIATNLLGPIRLTAALLPHLLRQAQSAIVNVSSGLAFVPLTSTPTYSATKAAIHSYTISLRHQLQGTRTEVIELVPPGVQTDLMPGHAANPAMMPLENFISETMSLFSRQPTPAEICVQQVNALRRAEAEGRFEQVLNALNPQAEAAA
jgi:uncharacterized oxidoreductase